MTNTNIMKVMGEGGIRVPAIQRDYVMGRPEEDVDKKIRTSLEFFFKAAFDGDRDPLYFVYGLREKEGSPLMLLDGQQRLTTLVLLAWFLDDPKSQSGSGLLVSNWKFEYETRRTASDFMAHLLNDTILTDEDRTEPWRAIERSDWYLPEMESDATVASVHKVLNIMGEMYKDRGAPILPDVRKVLERICFSCEDMSDHVKVSDSAANDKSFDQIFLKMNARGLPLTAWEKMKSVLDQRGDKTWKEKIDGTWAEKLWEIVGKNIHSLDCAMRKVVTMAIRRQFWRVAESKVRKDEKWLFDLIDMKMGEKQGQNSIQERFWKDCRRYFECVVGGNLEKCWSYNRSQNALWGAADSIGRQALKNFLVKQSFSFLELLRFDLMATEEFKEAAEWTRRILLNVLDAVGAVPQEEIETLYNAFIRFLDDENAYEFKSSLKTATAKMSSKKVLLMKAMLNQLDQEIYKIELKDEPRIKQLELDPLVCQSRIAFLLWGERPNSVGGLELRLNELKDIIAGDGWIKFFCDILNNLTYSDHERSGLDRIIAIPYHDPLKWAECLFDTSEIVQAVARLQTSPTKEMYPAWLRHLEDLLNESNGSIGGALKYDNWRWIYICPRDQRIMPNSIRLDHTDNERNHRLQLLESAKRIHKKEVDAIDLESAGVKGLSRDDYPEAEVYYDVNAESWWQDAGVPKPKYTKPLAKQSVES